MLKIGLIKEGKTPQDNRVAFSPKQCRFLQENKSLKVIVQPSSIRCFTDDEYRAQGIEVANKMEECDVLFGIKEIPVEMLIADKEYFFFSHTKKLQPYNQNLFRAIIDKKITLVDYEALEHEDGTRLLGFGFFAGVVGAHNGMLAYGTRTGTFHLDRVYKQDGFDELVTSYFELKVPHIKIAVTGGGRVAHGILEVMNFMSIREVNPEDFRSKDFKYPVYVNLKSDSLYRNKKTGKYDREEFHSHPEMYECLFKDYLNCTDILMNGIYWEKPIPLLFETEDMKNDFRIVTISDITDDKFGSVPCNLGDVTMKEMVYGVDKQSGERTAPYISGSVDMLAVGNLPNELPKDASKYFGEQLIKYIVDDLQSGSETIRKATFVDNGKLTDDYAYMKKYAGIDL